MTGVVYTRDVENNLPYYVVMYNDADACIPSVGDGNHTVYIAKNTGREFLSDGLVSLISAVKKIEKETKTDELNIEFRIGDNAEPEIVNVKPLDMVKSKNKAMPDKEFRDTKALAKCSYLDKVEILSDRAFCNPIGVLGTDPRPLDYSLFNEMHMATIWSSGRSMLGYQAVEQNLMQKIGNRPYISVNCIFDGLTPANLPQQFRYRLNQLYERKLREDNTLHYKLEYDVIYNVYDFNIDQRLKKLENEDFSEDEISLLRRSLFKITNNTISRYDRMIADDEEVLRELFKIRSEISCYNPLQETNVLKLYKYLSELMSAIKKYGTLQFARHDRCMFMAKIMCKSLVDRGLVSVQDMAVYMNGITVVKPDIMLGAYDIRNDEYRQSRSGNMQTSIEEDLAKLDSRIKLDKAVIDKAIKEAGFTFTYEQFDSFIKKSINYREKIILEYRSVLCLILDIIVRVGDLLGIAREDMSYLEIDELLSYHSRDSYIQIIEQRRNMYHAYSYLILPDVIFGVGDIDVIEK